MTITSAVASLENRLQQIISNIRNLPTPPQVLEQIQKVMSEPDASIVEIARIISEDPAMSVKILRLTNSAYYGLSREIESVSHAVMITGLEAVRNLVLSASVLSMFKSTNLNRAYHENFWRHSLSAALSARLIAKDFQGGKVFNPEAAFSAGLIHDIGKMITCCFMLNEHKQIIQYLDEHPDVAEMEAEIAIMGFNHAQLGRQLAITWKLPERLADTIGYHHSPALENASGDYAHLINLASYIAHTGLPGECDQKERYKIDPGTIELFKADETFITDVRSRLIDEYAQAETFLKIAGL